MARRITWAGVQIDADHNYNRQSREAMYGWFGRWLLDREDAAPIREQPFEPEERARLLVFADKKLPAHAVGGQQFVDEIICSAQMQLQSRQPTDSASLETYRELMGVAYGNALNAQLPGAGDMDVAIASSETHEGYRLERLFIRQSGMGERIPALLFVPEGATAAALLVHPRGSTALLTADAPGPPPGGAAGAADGLDHRCVQHRRQNLPGACADGRSLPDLQTAQTMPCACKML